MAKAKLTTKKSVSKTKVSTVAKRKPRLLQVLVGIMVVLSVVFVGTIIYAKIQERDIKAKAAATQLNPNDYEGNKNSGVRFAMCQRPWKNDKNYVEIVGIVSRPSLLYFNYGGTHFAYLTEYNSVNQANLLGMSRSSDSWFASGPLAYTYVTHQANIRSAIALRYEKSIVKNQVYSTFNDTRVATKRIPVMYIPKC